jgi:hypothetical protein
VSARGKVSVEADLVEGKGLGNRLIRPHHPTGWEVRRESDQGLVDMPPRGSVGTNGWPPESEGRR